MIDISEKNFEATIEQALLAGGPDAVASEVSAVASLINYSFRQP